MRSVRPFIVIALLLLAATLPACAPSPPPDIQPPVHPSTLPPASPGRGLLQDFDLLTEHETVEADVSDPAKASASFTVVVRSNGTLPLSVRLSATLNLGGKVALEPALTPLMIYGATTNVLVSATLPGNTTSDSMGYLRIDGVCNENPTVTESLQVRLAIRQWHRVTIERFSLSSGSPVQGETVTLTARVLNSGNGPSRFSASARVDGKPLAVRLDGLPAPANTTVSLGPGKFFGVAANWEASPGRHSLVLEVTDVGGEGEANVSGVMSRDSRTASVSVGLNVRDLIPFVYITIIVLVAAALLGYKYQRKLVPRLRRVKRILKRGEPGSEGDESCEEEEEYQDEEYEERAPPPRRARGPPPGRPAAPPGRAPASWPGRAPGPDTRRPAPLPARRRPAQEMRRPGTRPPAPAGRAPARPAPRTNIIMVGAPGESPGPPRRPREVRVGKEEEE